MEIFNKSSELETPITTAGPPADQRSESVAVAGAAEGPHDQADSEAWVEKTDRRDASWDLREGPKNYVVLVSTQVASAVFSFLAVWIATRQLGPAGYGGVVAIIAASQIVILLAINWTGMTVTRYGCQEFVETGRIASAFWTRLAIVLPNVGLVIATIPFWLPKVSEMLHLPPRAGWLVIGLILANILWGHVQQALQGLKLLRLQGWLLTVERALIFFSMGWLALSGAISVWSVCCVYALGPLLASVVGLLRIRKLIWPVGGIDLSLLRRMLKFAVPLIPAAFIGYLSSYYFDALFILHFLSESELGVYAVVYQLTGLTQQLPALAGTLLMPFFVTLQTDKNDNRTARFIVEVLPLLTLLWTLACAFVATAGWYLLPLIFGAKFSQTAPLLWPLMAASAFVGPWLMGYGPITTSAARTPLITIAVLSGSCANVGLNWILIPRFGLLGCAWATTVASAINLVIIFYMVHRSSLAKRTWTLQAVLPIGIGALYASVFGENIVAFGLTVMASLVIGVAHRKSLIRSLATMREYGRFVSHEGSSIARAREAL